MIKTKADLNCYLKYDKIALGIEKNRPSVWGDRIWKWQILLRKSEYHYNNRKKFFHKLLYHLYYSRFKRTSRQFCSEIPLNVFEKGLVIWHGENIIVNAKAKVGENFSISSGCCIGQAHEEVPVIGDNVVMTIGSRVLGGIYITNDVTIGAGAVVVKSITEPFTTWGGVPAKCISHKLNKTVEERKLRLANFNEN